MVSATRSSTSPGASWTLVAGKLKPTPFTFQVFEGFNGS